MFAVSLLAAFFEDGPCVNRPINNTAADGGQMCPDLNILLYDLIRNPIGKRF